MPACGTGHESTLCIRRETGDILFNGGGADEQMGLVREFSTPIVAKGRIVVAAQEQQYAFTTQGFRL